MAHETPYNKNYIHHNSSRLAEYVREIIFGMQDGMVSTLGALTGIAVGSGSSSIVILSGLVIIAVESVSMGMGSYISSSSEGAIEKRKLREEKEEIENFPVAETNELKRIYIKDGWPADLAKEMADTASRDKELMLNEMAYHEMGVIPTKGKGFVVNGIYMFFSYIVGGLIPLTAYFFLPISSAVYISVAITLVGLFTLGVGTTKFTKQDWKKSGLRMLGLGTLTILVGYIIGSAARNLGINI